MSLRVLILHNAVAPDASAAESDVLTQVCVVEQACRKLGHAVERFDCTLNLERVAARLDTARPDVVFNLVESLGGSDRLASLVPALLAARRVPFTGSSQAALDLTNDKPRAKQRLVAHSLPTPAWLTMDGGDCPFVPGRYIIKATAEHASLGLDDSSIGDFATRDELLRGMAERSARFPGGGFAEQFIEGREFNLSLLAGANGPEVLPPAEIDFSAFPAGKPRIVGYDAKWSDESFEFVHTPRRFDLPANDEPLVRQLEYLAKACWRAFDLNGYVRVDFRVDQQGQPWILEINTNPCLSPDAGFAAALERGNIPSETAVQRILDAAIGSCSSQRFAESAESRGVGQGTGASLTFRSEVKPSDVAAVRSIVAATGKFRLAEVDVAVELVEERLAKGTASGYEFVFAELGGEVVGYACFGQITVTVDSYDLYWIAVDPQQQSRGLGKMLLARAEAAIAAAGGKQVYIETSGRADYWQTRAFYEACGYRFEARVADFYAPGDDKVLYVRRLG